MRFVDPANNATPLNDDDGSEFTHDSADDFAEDVAERHSSVSGKHNVAVDDLLSSPRYVDAKALKRSTQAEIERIERERHSHHFASYAHVTAPTRKKRSSFLWAILLTCMVIGGGWLSTSQYFNGDVGLAFASAKSTLVDMTNLSITRLQNAMGSGSEITKPVVQAEPAHAPVAQLQTFAPVIQQSQPAVQQQAVGQAPVNNTSPLAKSLFELGALSCIARANQISKFLSDGNEAIVLQKPVGNADRSLLMATLLPTGADKKQDFSIVTLSPNQASGCDGNYQSIRVIEKPCQNAVAEIYGANRARKIGDAGVVMIAINQLTRIFAIPYSNICVMVKQEQVQ